MSKQQMKWGVVLTFLSMTFSMIIGLVFTPYIIKLLGEANYGLYNLVRSFVGYFYLLEFGISAAIVRYVAKYTTEKNTKKRDELLSLSLWTFIIIDVIIIFFAILVINNLSFVFPKLNSLELEQAQIMLYFLFFSVVINIISNVFLGALYGSNLFIKPRLFALFSEFFRILGIIYILHQELDALALVLLSSFITVFVALFNSYYAIKKLKIKIYFNFWDKELFKKIAIYSGFIFIGMLMGGIYWELDVFIIANMLGTASVALYAIAMQLNGIFKMMVTAITSVILPKATKMAVSKETSKNVTLFLSKIGRLILIVYLLMILGFFFFGKNFIKLWLGENFLVVWNITIFVVLAAFIPRIQGGINDYMKAKNKHKFLAFLYLGMALFNIILTVLFIDYWGVEGAAYATGFGLIIGNVFIANYYYKKYLSIDILTFFKVTFSNFYIPLVLMLFIGYAINYFFVLNSWLYLAFAIFGYTILYILLIWVLTLTSSEKEFFKSFIPKI